MEKKRSGGDGQGRFKIALQIYIKKTHFSCSYYKQNKKHTPQTYWTYSRVNWCWFYCFFFLFSFPPKPKNTKNETKKNTISLSLSLFLCVCACRYCHHVCQKPLNNNKQHGVCFTLRSSCGFTLPFHRFFSPPPTLPINRGNVCSAVYWFQFPSPFHHVTVLLFSRVHTHFSVSVQIPFGSEWSWILLAMENVRTWSSVCVRVCLCDKNYKRISTQPCQAVGVFVCMWQRFYLHGVMVI